MSAHDPAQRANIALCRALGVDPSGAQRLTLTLEPNELPRLLIERCPLEVDAVALEEFRVELHPHAAAELAESAERLRTDFAPAPAGRFDVEAACAAAMARIGAEIARSANLHSTAVHREFCCAREQLATRHALLRRALVERRAPPPRSGELVARLELQYGLRPSMSDRAVELGVVICLLTIFGTLVSRFGKMHGWW